MRLQDRLIEMANVGDMGRPPVEDCTLRLSAKRIDDLEGLLFECASKLESQIHRNPNLPISYGKIVKSAFELINKP